MSKKPSFFARLTGAGGADDGYFSDKAEPIVFEGEGEERHAHITQRDENWAGDEPAGELAVDVYQTPDAMVVKALVAGVHPASIDISLTREMLTISGPGRARSG